MRVLKGTKGKVRGLTLTELLCVMAILAILAGMYVPAILRAFFRVKKFLTGF